MCDSSWEAGCGHLHCPVTEQSCTCPVHAELLIPLQLELFPASKWLVALLKTLPICLINFFSVFFFNDTVLFVSIFQMWYKFQATKMSSVICSLENFVSFFFFLCVDCFWMCLLSRYVCNLACWFEVLWIVIACFLNFFFWNKLGFMSSLSPKPSRGTIQNPYSLYLDEKIP